MYLGMRGEYRSGFCGLRAGAFAPATLDHYGWQQHCRGLFEIPVAA
jgi:hypothetical protein